MAQLSAATSADQAIKMLLIGDSGTGKTGSLVSLVEAGYRLCIIDTDNGLDSLIGQLKAKPNSSELFSRVHALTIQDKLKPMAGKIVAAGGPPKGFATALAALDHWKDSSEDLGRVDSWGLDTVLVIDSLTMLSNMALRHTLGMKGRVGDAPEIQEWGDAMAKIEGMLSLLYSDYIQCHVIILAHITYIEDDAGKNKGYPSSLGNKLPPKIGRYFNTMLQMVRKGTGTSVKRVFLTQPQSTIDVKCPCPALPAELPIETGLAQFFKEFTGRAKAPAAGATTPTQQ